MEIFDFCVLHPNELAKRYCTKCKVNICYECSLSNHSTHIHDLIPVEKISQTNYNSLKKFLLKPNKEMLNMFCSYNTAHSADIFCISCSKFYCTKCASAHQLHETTTINNFYNELLANIEFILYLTGQETDVNIFEDKNVITVLLKYEKIINELICAKNKVMEIINERIKTIVTLIEEYKLMINEKRMNIDIKQLPNANEIKNLYEKIMCENNTQQLCSLVYKYKTLFESFFKSEEERIKFVKPLLNVRYLKELTKNENENLMKEFNNILDCYKFEDFNKVINQNITKYKNEVLNSKREITPSKMMKKTVDNGNFTFKNKPINNSTIKSKADSIRASIINEDNIWNFNTNEEGIEKQQQQILVNENQNNFNNVKSKSSLITTNSKENKITFSKTLNNSNGNSICVENENKKVEKNETKEKDDQNNASKKLSAFDKAKSMFDKQNEMKPNAKEYTNTTPNKTMLPESYLKQNNPSNFDINKLKNIFEKNTQQSYNETKETLKKENIPNSKLLLQNEESTKKSINKSIKNKPIKRNTQIMAIKQNSQSLFIFDSSTNTISELELESLPTGKFLANLAFINVFPDIYISGGINSNTNKPDNNFYKITKLDNNNSYSITKLESMNKPRSKHSMAYHPIKKIIFSLSGTQNNTCEQYSLTKELWSFIPNLKYPRENPTILFHNDYLYVFFGYNIEQRIYCSSIERIMMNEEYTSETRWEIIEPLLNKDKLKFTNYGYIINENSLWLLGGVTNQNKQSDAIMEYNFDNKKVSVCDGINLPFECGFIQGGFIAEKEFKNHSEIMSYYNFTTDFKIVEYSREGQSESFLGYW